MIELFVTKAYADVPGPLIPIVGMNFQTLVGNVLQVILLVAGILATVYLIIAGIQYITAGGDATKATAARTGIVNAVIGIIIIIIAFSLVTWIINAVSTGTP